MDIPVHRNYAGERALRGIITSEQDEDECASARGGAMQISWRVAFLIVAAAGAMHLSLWKVFVVLVGYLGFEQLDRRLSQRAKEKAIHDVMCGWKVSAEDPEYEDKGEVSRARLTGSDQIITARVAELMTRV